MKRNEKARNGLYETKQLGLQDYLEIFWRRKWWFALPVMIGTILAVMYSYSLTPLYRSSTLILVEPQKVPSSYVSPTVTSSVEDRLNTISQQILSRTNLSKIIEEYSLYKQDHVAPSGIEGVATRLRRKVRGLLATFSPMEQEESPAWEPARYVERMREAIEIKVMGGRRKNAFTVAYSGRNPETVRQVTNALASLFIEENLKVRERQAEGTSEFLASELAAAERELQALESRLKEFKERHRGALPEQLDANLRTLDRLQLELQTVNDALKSAEDRKMFYEQQLDSVNSESQTTPVAPVPSAPQPLEAELNRLQGELGRLQAQFTDTYPDIVILKNRIQEVESRLAGVSTQDPESPVVSTSGNNPQRSSQLQVQLRKLSADIESLKERQGRIIFAIRGYEKRIEQTYDNELKLLTLTRDYGISKRNYEGLLAKKLNAKMSENLERRQKGEQFKVLDPANLPLVPYRPARAKIILIGSLISGAVGAGLIFLVEFLNPCFRKPEDLQEVLDSPVLATIPSERVTRKNKPGRVVAMEAPDSLATEQYRILYAKLHDLNREKGHRVFAVSSALPGEGKTVTTLNLAVVMARDFGKKTLFLEGDFKAPVISHYLKTELESGLVDILLSKTDIQSTSIPFADTLIPFADDNLSVLPAVKSVQNSSGLLSSQRMRDLLETLKEQYDFILIDAPPVVALSDMQLFEEVVDGIILLVRAEKTPRDILAKAVHALGTDKLAGIVLNDVRGPLPASHRRAYARV